MHSFCLLHFMRCHPRTHSKFMNPGPACYRPMYNTLNPKKWNTGWHQRDLLDLFCKKRSPHPFLAIPFSSQLLSLFTQEKTGIGHFRMAGNCTILYTIIRKYKVHPGLVYWEPHLYCHHWIKTQVSPCYAFLAAVGSLMVFCRGVFPHWFSNNLILIECLPKPLYIISSSHSPQFQQSPYRHIVPLLHYLHQV